MVTLQKLLCHARDSGVPTPILNRIRAIAHGKQSGTKNQLGPPCPEYEKFRPGIIATANITIANPYVATTSRQKRPPKFPRVAAADCDDEGTRCHANAPRAK